MAGRVQLQGHRQIDQVVWRALLLLGGLLPTRAGICCWESSWRSCANSFLHDHENNIEPIFPEEGDENKQEYEAPGYSNGVSRSAKKKPIKKKKNSSKKRYVGRGTGRAKKRPCKPSGEYVWWTWWTMCLGSSFFICFSGNDVALLDSKNNNI